MVEKLSKQTSHSLDSEQYLLYRLSTLLEDDLDSYMYLPHVFKDFHTIKIIKKVIFLIHSTYDMCTKCSVSMALDYASDSGCMATFSDLVVEHNQWINYIFKYDEPTKPQLNVIVASSAQYQEHGTSFRSYVNYRQEDDCLDDATFSAALASFWKRRFIMQWRIPTYKLTPLVVQKQEKEEEEEDSSVSDLSAFFG